MTNNFLKRNTDMNCMNNYDIELKKNEFNFTLILEEYRKSFNAFFYESGGIYERKRQDSKPAFLFTEVTGYAILDCLTLYQLSGNKMYLDIAHKNANWIITNAQDICGGVLTRFYFENDLKEELEETSFNGRRIYAFDTAICIKGIASLFNFTKSEYLLEPCKKMASFLIEKMIQKNGKVHAIYNAKTGKILDEDTSKWSQCSGSYHTKVAEALLEMYEAENNEVYKETAILICNMALDFQHIEGNFETSNGMTELHPYGYSIEGLLDVGIECCNDVYIKSACRAVEWVLDRCENGIIPQRIPISEDIINKSYRIDSLSQIVALASDLLRIGELDNKYFNIVTELVNKILEHRVCGTYFDLDSSYCFYQYGYFENGDEAKTLSYWTNMFCLRGLYKYYLMLIINNLKVVILAGGKGTRCWPISCRLRPKSFINTFLDDHSLLQETIRRISYQGIIPKKNIYVTSTSDSVLLARIQAHQEGIPSKNVIIDNGMNGTLNAINHALRGKEFNEYENPIIIVSMADNVIDNYKEYQNALIRGMIAAYEEKQFVSIGKEIDIADELDSRFGHMRYESSQNKNLTYKVKEFIEKPNVELSDQLKSKSGNWAWECGIVFFQKKYYEELSIPYDCKNIAQDLLSTVGKKEGNLNLKMSVSLMLKDIRFEDFGVPGENIIEFFKNKEKDKGNENICLTKKETDVELVNSYHNVIVSDNEKIRVNGIKNHIIISSRITNTLVVIKLENVKKLEEYCNLLMGKGKPYSGFVIGGKRAYINLEEYESTDNSEVNFDNDLGLVLKDLDSNVTIIKNNEFLEISYNKLNDY